MHDTDETHDPALRSWVDDGAAAHADFPVQNLPFGVFRRRGSGERWCGGVAIGDGILDLAATVAAGGLGADAEVALHAAAGDTLNALMALGPRHWRALRLALSRALREGSPARDRLRPCLVAQSDAEHALPARIGDYTDFYTSIHHATAVGRLLRPDNPLLPNYRWLPIAYHGRASSIRISGHAFPRPWGQTLPPGAGQPVLGPSRRLDFELEIGVYVGEGNAPGEPVAIGDAGRHLFGLCLLDDWSARDIQAWEYQPLGPFLAKNFATTVSPWIVTMAALAPFRAPRARPAGDPPPLAYLDDEADREHGAVDVRLEALIETARMRAAGAAPARLCATSSRHAYWTPAQMVAHHTVNGCELRPGDLLGTGTLSGPAPDEAGALIELTAGGSRPVELPAGERRAFLEDGDSVVLRGWCERPGAVRIGFGECRGTVLPARR